VEKRGCRKKKKGRGAKTRRLGRGGNIFKRKSRGRHRFPTFERDGNREEKMALVMRRARRGSTGNLRKVGESGGMVPPCNNRITRGGERRGPEID